MERFKQCRWQVDRIDFCIVISTSHSRMEKCGSPQMNRILTFSIPFQYTFARAAQCNYYRIILSYFTLLFYFIIIYYYIIIYFLLFLLLIITVVLVVKNDVWCHHYYYTDDWSLCTLASQTIGPPWSSRNICNSHITTRAKTFKEQVTQKHAKKRSSWWKKEAFEKCLQRT